MIGDGFVHDQVAQHASLAGDRTAVVCGGQRLSYAELNARSDRLAGRLCELGIGPERVAGVLLDRDLDLPVALLAVLKSGAAYLPLDPDHPDERIAYQLGDVRAGALLTNARLVQRVNAASCEIVRVDETEIVANQDALALARVSVRADGIAYVMHTSGTTGRPKPVAITHRGLRSHAAALGTLLELVPADRVLQHASIAFDVSAEELYPTWCAGATVVMAPAAGLPAAAFERLVESQRVSVLNLPSGYFAQWARHVVERGGRPPGCLRLVVIGSEAADAETAAAWLRHTGVPVVNAYGVTEATITTTAQRVRTMPVRPLVPIGRPLIGTETHLLDADLRPVPEGEEGELCVGGAGLARGYHGRPGATAERFVPHPAAPGQRLYRTGDLARLLPDGAIELRGRADEQVKVRGHRVEPTEVAAALRAHPDVEDAHVVHHELPRGGCLTGYVVPRDSGRAPAAGDLRARLRRRLPDFMVPDAFVVLDRLPRTATGKIDRRALPVPAPAAAPAAYVPPHDEIERAVARVWQEVLGVERVGRHDDFLAVSGNSLLAIQLLNRLHAATGAEVSLRELLAGPTVAELARRVGRPGAARPAPPALTAGPRRRLAPLSAQQEQVWLVCRLAPESVAYNVQTSVRIAGEVRVEPLERALAELVRRHEILRTTFEEVDGRPLQVVRAPWPVTVARVDLREHPPAERAARAEAAIEREVARPFDLGRLPLLRWTLLQLDDASCELLVVEHHLLTDGTSFATALRELTALYDTCAAGGEPAPSDPPLQYADFARWQQSAAESPALRAQLAHWTSRLAGAPPALELAADRPRPRRQRFSGGLVRTDLPVDAGGALRAFCRERRVTLFSGLLAAFVALLHRSTGADDLCVGSAFANRALPGSEALLGMLVNTVVLRWRLGDDPSFAELVYRAHEEFLDASAHQELPFRWLVEALNPARDGAVNPMVQVMFSFDNAPLPALGPGGPATVLERHNGSSKMDLNVIVEPWAERGAGGLDDRIALRWEYDDALFDRSTVERMAERLARLLAAALDDPGARLSRLPLLAPEERERVTLAWNATAAPPPEAGRVTELVRRRAAAAPDAPAVVTPAGSIDYATLVRRAGAVASALRAAGVGPEATVGVLASRSVELAVANLGVLLAGAAYVPLDPEHPAGRLAFIARDAGVAAVLADRVTAGEAAASLPGVTWLQDVADAAAPPARAGGLAYVMYTSGSTGTPKGVAVEHRGLENLAGWHRRRFALGPGDRVSMVAAPGFDASAWELWPALAAGAAVHVPDAEVRLAPERMRDWLLERRITVAFLPTPLAEAVLALPWPATAPLRVLLTGGDRLRVRPDPALPFVLVNNYGPTESTVVATSGAVAAGEGPAPAIGGPIDNVRAYVVDRHLGPVPPGVPGELLVGAAGLARGYRGRPDLTAERFVPSPFGGPGERLYRTGDRVRWRGDGSLEFLGRADEQVKIRGFRVEPAEIVAALAAHPGVRQADVAVREAGEDKRLVAYVVGQATAEELRAHCAERLPAYMVPATFHLLDALPLLPSGKVDRRALAELAPPVAEPAAGEELQGETEERIAGVWREVLGVERVGRHDSFFDLGGHSLLSARIAVRLGHAFGIKVPLTVLFDHPTVAGLATVVSSKGVPGEPVDA